MAARSLRRCRRGLACTPGQSVDGEQLESTTFDVPAGGGVRTILVAGLGLGTGGGAPARGASAASSNAGGALSFGNNTRFAIEFQDDTIAVFYLLEIVNQLGRAGRAGLAPGHRRCRPRPSGRRCSRAPRRWRA